MTVLFVALAILADWLRPAGENRLPALLRVLNQQKYPASQLFLMMTLGPSIAVLPLLERARGWVAAVFATFGRVPMFYYVLHVPTIHVSALFVNLIRTGSTNSGPYATAPYVGMPPAQRWSLALLDLVFIVDIALLHVPCRWFAGVKARGRSKLLSYL